MCWLAEREAGQVGRRGEADAGGEVVGGGCLWHKRVKENKRINADIQEA